MYIYIYKISRSAAQPRPWHCLSEGVGMVRPNQAVVLPISMGWPSPKLVTWGSQSLLDGFLFTTLRSGLFFWVPLHRETEIYSIWIIVQKYCNIWTYVYMSPVSPLFFEKDFKSLKERKERRCLWSLFLSAWKMVYVTMLTWIQSFNALIFLFVSIKKGGWNWLEHLVFKCKEGRQVGKHVFDLWFCQDEEWWMKLTWTNQVWKWKGEWNGQHMTTPPW